jgi:hypothetical protein
MSWTEAPRESLTRETILRVDETNRRELHSPEPQAHPEAEHHDEDERQRSFDEIKPASTACGHVSYPECRRSHCGRTCTQAQPTTASEPVP